MPAHAADSPENAGRRWYPVIDYSRCTNCMECIDFCLFGVYGLDEYEMILVEQPDHCRKGCPACSRICPENAIMFPQHRTPSIAGDLASGTTTKLNLSELFGGSSEMEVAARERDEHARAAANDRSATGPTAAHRQTSPNSPARDELDDLIEELDQLDL